MGWFARNLRSTVGGMPVVLVRTTVETRTQAETLARRLVDARLAACVHVSEVASVYRWQGRVLQETEFLVEARTFASRSEATAAAMLEGHPYQQPLVEVTAPTQVNKGYGQWMKREVV